MHTPWYHSKLVTSDCLARVIKYVLMIPGIPKLITTDMVKEGAAVIDVGINHIHDPLTGKTKLVGDVDFEGQWNSL